LGFDPLFSRGLGQPGCRLKHPRLSFAEQHSTAATETNSDSMDYLRSTSESEVREQLSSLNWKVAGAVCNVKLRRNVALL
jgi:hypothetical protein